MREGREDVIYCGAGRRKGLTEGVESWGRGAGRGVLGSWRKLEGARGMGAG